MKIVTTQQMRDIEQRAAKEGLSLGALMENAGLAFAREVERFLGGVAGRHVVVLVGPGNNGGDGLVAARHLHDWRARVTAVLCAPRSESDPVYKAALESGMEVRGDLSHLETLLAGADVVADALLGTGALRPIEGRMREALDMARAASQKRPELGIIALDLPSGVDADSGAVDPAALGAHLTVTLGYPKVGLFRFPGANLVGRLTTADIGLPPHLAEEVIVSLLTPEWVKAHLPRRPLDANKGTFGRVLLLAGSINYLGAAALACTAALRVGAGLVTLATPHSLLPILATKLTEVTYLPLSESALGMGHVCVEAWEQFREELTRYDVLLAGCGLGQHPSTRAFLEAMLVGEQRATLPHMVLDADALNLLSNETHWWSGIPPDSVLTPHPGEMARLMGCIVADVQADRWGVAQRLAQERGTTVVLKGAFTAIASPNGQVWVSPFANPGLASAGTGDVLAGAIAGLLGQGLSPLEAAAGGVYLHGQAGEAVRQRLGEAGMVAGDLLPELPLAIKSVKG